MYSIQLYHQSLFMNSNWFISIITELWYHWYDEIQLYHQLWSYIPIFLSSYNPVIPSIPINRLTVFMVELQPTSRRAEACCILFRPSSRCVFSTPPSRFWALWWRSRWTSCGSTAQEKIREMDGNGRWDSGDLSEARFWFSLFWFGNNMPNSSLKTLSDCVEDWPWCCKSPWGLLFVVTGFFTPMELQ